MVFSDCEALKQYLEKKVARGLATTVAKGVMLTETRQAEEKVYSVYSEPVVYKRRRANGGLIDPSNQRIEVLGTTLSVYNETPPSSDYDTEQHGCKVIIPDNLVELIEYGGKYTHRHSHTKPEGPTFLKPRPFMQGTVDELRSTERHVDDLAKYLRSQGMTVIET